LLLQSSIALWRREFWRELLRQYSDFRREGNFPESKLSSFCSGGIRNTHEHLSKPFFCSGGILFTQNTKWVFCSAGNPPPRENPGIKCTRTNDILKKFEFKMNILNEKHYLPKSCEAIPLSCCNSCWLGMG
jgi:hypothetical protein